MEWTWYKILCRPPPKIANDMEIQSGTVCDTTHPIIAPYQHLQCSVHSRPTTTLTHSCMDQPDWHDANQQCTMEHLMGKPHYTSKPPSCWSMINWCNTTTRITWQSARSNDLQHGDASHLSTTQSQLLLLPHQWSPHTI